MRRVQAGLLALLLLCCGVGAFAQLAVPALTGRVVDQTSTLSANDRAALDRKLADFEARKGSQIVVLIVPTTQPDNIEQFSIRVAETWKIGRSKVDDGAILLIVKNDRKMRIEVGYGLEGALTDAVTRRIIDEEIAPRFKTGDFAGGINAGVERMMKVIDGEPLPAPPAPSEWKADTALFDQLFEYAPFLLFGAFIGGSVLRAMLGRLLGALVAGGLVMAAVWLIVSSAIAGAICGFAAFIITVIGDSALSTGRGSSGRSSGGSWSSGSSGSSSSSGGFSGGGGSFGGGGASGSW